MTTTTTHARNAELAELAQLLNERRTRAIDLVMPAGNVHTEGGAFVVSGAEPMVTDDGVTTVDGAYRPTGVGLEGVAAKLDIPIAYLRRTHAEYPALFDANVNGWLGRDGRSFLLRLMRGDDGPGALRAFLSDSYRCIDNFDVLLASLQGIRDAGVVNPTIRADLTDRRMVVRVTAPEIVAYAPELLAGYRSPFTGASGADNPGVFAGFAITNSETGNGAFTIVPRLEVQVCSNGMTITRDATREIHLGSKLDSGVVRWSDATIAKNLDLVKSQTRDAVATFLDVEYVQKKVAEMERAAGVKLSNPQETITTVSKRLGFTQDQQNAILSHFITGGQVTAGGVMQAVTSAAQVQDDGDTAYDMESKALAALELAVTNR